MYHHFLMHLPDPSQGLEEARAEITAWFKTNIAEDGYHLFQTQRFVAVHIRSTQNIVLCKLRWHQIMEPMTK